jgi:hypothetical protein
MKQPVVFFAILLKTACLFAQTPGADLSGVVTDSATGKPLAGVSVFLNNTSRGAVTRTDGSFLVRDIPRGRYELVFSAIGYATAVVNIEGSHLPSTLQMALHTQATELASVTVEPNDRHGWARWGKLFMENFIGTGENAASCDLRNRQVLRFHFSKKNNRLNVTATEPLIIDNSALGYTLEYRLEQFTLDLGSKTTTYFGYPFFQEMTAAKESRRRKWSEARLQAYRGSVMHFMRSLYGDHTIQEGFLAERKVTTPNEEKIRVKNIYRPDFQKPGAFPMDTLYHFWEVLRQPNIVTKMVIVPPDSILTTDADRRKGLFFQGELTILYGVNDRSGAYRGSQIRLITPMVITVQENGSYFPPQEMLILGSWAQSEKISNLLPLDYEPLPPPPTSSAIH